MSDAYDYGVARTGPLKLVKKKKDLFKKNKKKKEIKTTDIPKERRTDAEKRHDDMQMKRKMERIDKMAEKSYRERVKDFNEKLERAPEHNDMPKVGPG
ncbi:hypothetical protein IW146_000080 [Coemansia sp. RSA 922]|nr:hypothetical protein H4S03_003854 [Coemansia sp. S3946]KAJ2074861.1 hypothetical protein GGH13_001029 [Coemansia sp. S155-1]KAJ2079709.1 hypothetical protein GGI09_007867 [Coemansia sp. S100]KAJ2118230.1 hypothetical protein IW146_000080 [Coemansia sp. RSA 922]